MPCRARTKAWSKLRTSLFRADILSRLDIFFSTRSVQGPKDSKGRRHACFLFLVFQVGILRSNLLFYFVCSTHRQFCAPFIERILKGLQSFYFHHHK
jgi:hypothetical protein